MTLVLHMHALISNEQICLIQAMSAYCKDCESCMVLTPLHVTSLLTVYTAHMLRTKLMDKVSIEHQVKDVM